MDIFSKKYEESVKKYVPVVHVNSSGFDGKPNPKWFNREIKKAIRRKFKAFAAVRASSTESRPLCKLEFNKKCREVKRLVRAAHIEYEKAIIFKCKTDPKILYAYVNEQRGGKSPISLLADRNGISLTDGNDIANCLNDQYYDAFNRDTETREQIKFAQ